MNRTLAVARIHTMDHVNVLVLPWAVLASSLVINAVVWMLVPEAAATGTGGILSLYGVSIATISVLIGRGFPFQLGLGVTRRDFLRGTVLLVAVFAVASGLVLTGLNFLERATSGFGLGGRFFRVPWFTAVPDAELVAIYALPMVFFVGLGMLYAAVWSRFKTVGSVLLTIAIALVVVAAVALITWQEGWPSVGRWFSELRPMVAVGVLGAVGALAIAGSWLTLRRAPV